MEERNNFVYKHTSPNGKIYIGITKVDPKQRWSNGNGYYYNAHFNSAIQKYGWNNFTHKILYSGLTREEACEKERFLISFYHSDDPKYGYNRTQGGESNFSVSKETKELHRKAQKAHLASHPEHIAKLAEAARNKQINNWKSQEYRDYIIPVLKEAHKEVYNKKPELRSRMGKIASERWKIPEYRERFINALKSRTQSEHTRKLISDAQDKKPVICVETGETFESVVSASKSAGTHVSCIADCCHGRQDTSCGFHWRFANETQEVWNERRSTFLLGMQSTRGKSVMCVETGEVFCSAHAAAKHINGAKNGTQQSILKCCRGIRKSTHGYHWKFAD